ncbi:MAG: amino acid permease [Candidatus Woesearchaeota archaeon]|nr:amino acid permease [Candidatus Woesearchaeota archaeon]
MLRREKSHQFLQHKACPPHKPCLHRNLNLGQTTISGVGIIIGAGIYALIGIGTQTAGNALWLAFVIGACIAIFTGLSYGELASMFPRDAEEYDYAKHAFGKRIALIIGCMLIITAVVAIATVSLSFAQYLHSLTNIPIVMTAIILVIGIASIDYCGLRQSCSVNTVLTIVGVGGLLMIITAGFKNITKINLLEMPYGLPGVLSASALMFFAYMGFENVARLTEETKNPKKTIPRAMILSVIISSVVYILVALAVVAIVPWQQLGASEAPMALVAETLWGKGAFILLALIALISTAGTALMEIVTASRFVYGIAGEKALPKFLAQIDPKTSTPYRAIELLLLLTIVFVFVKDLNLVANIATATLFITFIMINLAVIVLRFKEPKMKRIFQVSGTIARIPVIPVLGIITSAVLLYFSIQNIIQVFI